MTTFNVPLAWSATVMTASGSRADRTYREVRAVDIPDVTSAQARPCILWERDNPEAGGGEAEAASALVLLAHGDEIYSPVRVRRYVPAPDYQGQWRVVPVSAEDLSRALAGDFEADGNQMFAPGNVLGLATTREAATVKLAPPKTIRFIHGQEKRDRAHAEVDAIANRFIVVDGMLHEKVPEPVLLACPKEACVRVASPSDLKEGERMRAYPLSEIDAAVEHASRVSGQAPSSIGLSRFEILDAEALSSGRGTLDIALWEAVRVIDGAAARSVSKLDVAGISLFCDLQDLRNPGRDVELDLDALASCVADLAAVVTKSTSDWSRECVEPAIVAARWHAHPSQAAAPAP